MLSKQKNQMQKNCIAAGNPARVVKQIHQTDKAANFLNYESLDNSL